VLLSAVRYVLAGRGALQKSQLVIWETSAMGLHPLAIECAAPPPPGRLFLPWLSPQLQGENPPHGNGYGEQKPSLDILRVSEIPGTRDAIADVE
jgi:hypothetical protein